MVHATYSLLGFRIHLLNRFQSYLPIYFFCYILIILIFNLIFPDLKMSLAVFVSSNIQSRSFIICPLLICSFAFCPAHLL